MPPPSDPLAELVDALARDAPLRVWSFLVTLFGDAIVPRGGTVDSSTVQAITSRIGIEPGTVRVAFSRLAKDGWIERRRSGRGSLYSLSDPGRAPFETASRRIYAAPGEARDDRPRLLAALSPERSDPDRWPADGGDGALALGDHLWLVVDRGDASRAALREAGALVTPAAFVGPPPEWLAKRLGLDRRAAEVHALVGRFAPFERAPPPDPLDALLVRLLLVHAWRRALLHAPPLPPMLHPADWPLPGARERVGALYRRLLPPSARWLDAHGRGPHGPLPPDDPAVASRFAVGGTPATSPGSPEVTDDPLRDDIS